MHESWQPLLDEASTGWKQRWDERKRGGFHANGMVSTIPFTEALRDLPGLVRAQCIQLESSVTTWLEKCSDLEVLSNAGETSSELIRSIRDGLTSSVAELRQTWQQRGIFQAPQLELASNAAMNDAELHLLSTERKIAQLIRFCEAAVQDQKDKDRKQDVRDRVRTYTPIVTSVAAGVIALVGGLLGKLDTSWTSWLVAAATLLTAFLSWIATTLFRQHDDGES